MEKMKNSEKLRRIITKIQDHSADINGVICAIETIAAELEVAEARETLPTQWRGIWQLPPGKDTGWLTADGSRVVIAWQDEEKAKRYAADEFGYDTYEEAVKDGW